MLSPNKLTQFKLVLDNYSPSQEAIDLLRQLNFVILVGPSGSGKNTIIRDMVKTGEYYYLVSDTTRNKRINNGVSEIDGVDYWFRNEDDFLQDLKKGQYLEAEVIHNQQVSGINLSELNKAKSLNKTAVADLDIGGVEKLLSLNPNIKVFLILPPSFKVWLSRLSHRNNMASSEIKRRLTTAIKIFQAAQKLKSVKTVLNTNYIQASSIIRLNVEQSKEIIQPNLKVTLETLLEETKQYLESPK